MNPKHFCKYPGCNKVGGTTWATVPICFNHYNVIFAETCKYYESKIGPKEREHYNKIRALTPWGKK